MLEFDRIEVSKGIDVCASLLFVITGTSSAYILNLSQKYVMVYMI